MSLNSICRIGKVIVGFFEIWYFNRFNTNRDFGYATLLKIYLDVSLPPIRVASSFSLTSTAYFLVAGLVTLLSLLDGSSLSVVV